MKLATRRESQRVPATWFMVPTVLAALLVAAGPAGAQLVNPGFDSGPAGPVGNFGPVVGPPASYGFWGAEDASIDNVTTCGTGPRSAPYMLTLNVGGGSHSQAWQAVDVSGGPPSMVSLRGWANTCSTAPGVTVGNLHASNDFVHPDVPRAEAARAAAFVEGVATPGDVVVLAGDFNVGDPLPEAYPAPDERIDHILVRGARTTSVVAWSRERRRQNGVVLSDHTVVEATIEVDAP